MIDTRRGFPASHPDDAQAPPAAARLISLPLPLPLPLPAPAAGREETEELLRRMGALGPGDGLRASLREAVIRDHMRHAWYIAACYRFRGVQGEDDVALAYRSLATAVDGFDPERHGRFLSYAVPVILREVKATRLDDAGQLAASRRAQQSADALRVSARRLTRDSGRSPSVQELAVAMGENCEDVVESLEAALGSAIAWIDVPETSTQGFTGSGGRGVRVQASPREAFAVVFARLENRAKQVLLMRFLRKMSQAQISAELGANPEQIARIQEQSLGRLGALWDNPLGDLADTPHSDPDRADGSHEITARPMRSGSSLLAA